MDTEEKKAKALRCRDQAVRELVETEKTYVDGLAKLIILYMSPLKRESSVIPVSDHCMLFPSVVTTIYSLHNQLLAELDYNYSYYNTADTSTATDHDNNNNNTESITVRIGKVLIKYAELFKMYQIYMNGYERAIKALQVMKKKNKKFTKWLQLQCSKISNSHSLENLLILPIQRIPRYQLLLKAIINETEKISPTHDDLVDLRKAYQHILSITNVIETKMREYDNRKKVAVIERRFVNVDCGALVTPSRTFIMQSKSGTIRLHHMDGSHMDVCLVLFNDCLIYGHWNEEAMDALSSKPRLYLDDTLAFDALFACALEDGYKQLHCLKVFSRSNSLWLSFASHRYRQKWWHAITDANHKANNKYITGLLQQRSSSSTQQQYLNLNLLYAHSSAAAEEHDGSDGMAAAAQQSRPYPCFEPDDYSNTCQQCHVKFTFTVRRSHCRQCGRLLCKNCTSYRTNCIFYNKHRKNQIIRCCKQCKDENNARRHKALHADMNNTSLSAAFTPRRNSSPSLKSPSLKAVAAAKTSPSPRLELKHRSCTSPLLLNSSSTLTIKMNSKAVKKTIHPSTHIRGRPHHHREQRKKRKNPRVPLNAISNVLLSDPQSEAQEQGYNDDGDDSLDDDEIDDGDIGISSMDETDEMPALDLKKTNIATPTMMAHARCASVAAKTKSNPTKPRSKAAIRTRSYALDVLNVNDTNTRGTPPNYVGCVVTDEDTTDGGYLSAYSMTSGGMSGVSNASSVESNGSSAFTKRSKIPLFKKFNSCDQERGSSKSTKHAHAHVNNHSFSTILDWD
mmetsp:Transcript_4922/g.8159  ORF Transcript_4922/g.8159 Transcript_4922/m.8159 type:complete len:792 (+) Transcript_4922:44-2419(+)